MAQRTGIAWCDSTHNEWIGCTKVSPACTHCYAEADFDIRKHRVKWGAGNARSRTSPDNRKRPHRWNKQLFCECESCGWRGEQRETLGGEPWNLCPVCVYTKPAPARRRVFSFSLADWLDNEVPLEWVVDFLDTVRLTPNLDWLLLTKRIGRFDVVLEDAIRYVNVHQRGKDLWHWLRDWENGRPPKNVWIGATICNQEEADRDIQKLLKVPAAVRFVSIEPMLGSINLRELRVGERLTLDALTGCHSGYSLRGTVDECLESLPSMPGMTNSLDWVIDGGESGAHARPTHPDWFRSLRDQCAALGVAYLHKQNGEWRPICEGDGDWYDSLYRSNKVADPDESQSAIDEMWGRKCTVPEGILHADGTMHTITAPGAFLAGAGAMHMFKVGKKSAGRLLDGVEHNGFPRSAA